MIKCPCKSNKYFQKCCELLIVGLQKAATPEELMRSRYTAYTRCNIDYIKKTMKSVALENFNYIEAKNWVQTVIWLDLEVLATYFKQNNSGIGYVEFKAYFQVNGEIKILHEKSEFMKENHEWFYIDRQLLSR